MKAYKPSSKSHAFGLFRELFNKKINTFLGNLNILLTEYINNMKKANMLTSSSYGLQNIVVDSEFPMLNEPIGKLVEMNKQIMLMKPEFPKDSSLKSCSLCGKRTELILYCQKRHYLCGVCAVINFLSTNVFIGNLNLWTKKCPVEGCLEFIVLQGTKEFEKFLGENVGRIQNIDAWNNAMFNDIYCIYCEKTSILSHFLNETTKHNFCDKCLFTYAKTKNPKNPFNLDKFNIEGEPSIAYICCPIPECKKRFEIAELKERYKLLYNKHVRKYKLRYPDAVIRSLNIIL